MAQNQLSTGQEPTILPTDTLLLDPQNPRLISDTADAIQEQLLSLLWEQMAVDELVLSIGYNGYYRQEPLLVIKADDDHDIESGVRFTVVEGNRRLAAVMLLRSPELQKSLG